MPPMARYHRPFGQAARPRQLQIRSEQQYQQQTQKNSGTDSPTSFASTEREHLSAEEPERLRGPQHDARRVALPVYKSVPDLVRIVIAIDPATTSGEDADETGIIVAGKDAGGRGYVLADRSGHYTPTEWAQPPPHLPAHECN